MQQKQFGHYYIQASVGEGAPKEAPEPALRVCSLCSKVARAKLGVLHNNVHVRGGGACMGTMENP